MNNCVALTPWGESQDRGVLPKSWHFCTNAINCLNDSKCSFTCTLSQHKQTLLPESSSSALPMPLATSSRSRIALFGELHCFHSDKFPDPLPHMATQILVSTMKEWSWDQTTGTWGQGRTASSGACPSLSQLKAYVKLRPHIK